MVVESVTSWLESPFGLGLNLIHPIFDDHAQPVIGTPDTVCAFTLGVFLNDIFEPTKATTAKIINANTVRYEFLMRKLYHWTVVAGERKMWITI